MSLSHHNVRLAEMRDAISIALLPTLKSRFVEGGSEQIKQDLVTDQTIGAKPGTGKKDIAKTRKSFIDPLLMEKGWSILDWANEAEVAYHTAADYLAGTTHPFRSSRAKLAKALNISPNTLPE
jgi:hypothetical protein